ncbi:MAG: sulfate permease [Gallionellaceae bacterium]|nr:sulfate permease [Gallionellaceae bacterium]
MPNLASLIQPFLAFRLWWPQVNRANLKDDAMAGLTGAMIVLPQGVAFATIAGLPPQYGLYAAMMPAIVAALFGSSWHLVSGPTTAISIALFASLHGLAEPGTAEYIRLALTLTFLVGLYQLVLGLARMGTLVNFISHTVVIGFTAGAAVLIAASQLKNFSGIPIARGTPFFQIIEQFLLRIGEANYYVVAVGAITLATGLLAKKFIPKFPYMIAAMVVGSVVAAVLNTLLGGEAVTGIRTVGALPAGLPPFSLPDFSFAALHETALPALVITLLALTEAVSISRAIATRSEQRIEGNQEFIGQGLSNIVGSFFSAYASSGSFNRSGVNYEAGARTPLATVFASVFLVIILLLVAPLAAYLPTAAMAGILFLVAWGLIDFHHIKSIWSTSKPETAVLWVTLIGTLANLEKGIFLGILLSLIMYLYRSSRPETEPVVPAGEPGNLRFVNAKGHPECPQTRFVRIHGSIYFGAVDHIQRALQQIDEDNPQHKTVVIIAPAINFVDVAGAEMLAIEARRRRRMGGGLYFWRLKDSVHRFLRQGAYLKHIGEGGFFQAGSNITGALYWTLDPNICRDCKTRIFKECQGELLPDGDRRLRLMFATDGTEYSQAPRAISLDLAKRLGVTLDVMTMMPPDAEPDQAERRLALVHKEAAELGVHCKEVVRHGSDPIRAVIDAAREVDSQLLVIGRTPPKGMTERKVGAHATRVIDEAPCHVLIVPKGVQPCRRRILVGYDANPSAQPALEMAAILAKANRVPVTLVSVVKEDSPSAPVLTELVEEAAASLRLEGIEAEVRIVMGAPASALIDAARETGADLIILGRRQGGLSRLLPGSPTDHLIGAAEWPVLIAKSLHDAEPSSHRNRI